MLGVYPVSMRFFFPVQVQHNDKEICLWGSVFFQAFKVTSGLKDNDYGALGAFRQV